MQKNNMTKPVEVLQKAIELLEKRVEELENALKEMCYQHCYYDGGYLETTYILANETAFEALHWDLSGEPMADPK